MGEYMKGLKGFFKKSIEHAEDAVEKASELVNDASKQAFQYWDDNKEDLYAQGKETADFTKEFVSSTFNSASIAATSLYRDIWYSDEDNARLKRNIENQGGLYRELNRRHTAQDSIVLGGETMATLLAATAVPDEILRAYEAAYPNLSSSISFQDQVAQLDSDALIGFVSGIKGKLFEQQYVEYLNDGNLPEGYTAILAESVTQKGWDIAIEGSNGEIASVLQAKATDSVSYVQDAIEKYPNIDVVTTDEVYSHLVMSGVSENIENGLISNSELVATIDEAVSANDIQMDFSPPLFALAFIAFTSYRNDSLTLYEKAKNAGDRTGKTYLSYLVGGGIAAITNIWWLGVLGSVSSRIISDSGERKYRMFEQLKLVEKNNQLLLEKLKAH